MFSLPESSPLGCLRIEHTFQFYDVPRLFTCTNNSGGRYLVLSVQDDYELFEWLYLPVSIDRISTLISKGVSLRDAFLNPEDNYLFYVTSALGGRADVKYISQEDLKSDDLPEKDVFIEFEGVIDVGLGEIDAQRAAVGSKRDTFNLHFYPWDTKLPELDIKPLGSILSSFQDLANALGQYCKGDVTLKGVLPLDVLEGTKFRATQIFSGSFGIQLKSKSTSDLFDGSLASDALLEMTDLLESRDNEDNISNKLHQLQGRVASKYRAFLKDVSKLDSAMKLQWGSPNSERGGSFSLSKQEIKRAYEVVSKIDIDMSESVSFRAELLGLDVKIKRYRVRHISDNEDYSGKIIAESIKKVAHSEINGIYNVTLKKMIETNYSSGTESTKWMLVDLESTS